MELRKPMTPTEIQLFKEAVIRQYKLKNEANSISNTINRRLNKLLMNLRSIVPINIAIGTIATIILVYYKGWDIFFQLLLTAIIWITLISTILGAVAGKKN